MKINGRPVNGVSVTVAQSGSAAGDVDGVNPIASYTSNYASEGDAIEFISNGASTGTCPVTFTAVIRQG